MPEFTFAIKKCPKCGAEPRATADVIYGDAVLHKDGKGFRYAGETKLWWDSQQNVLSAALESLGSIVNLYDFLVLTCAGEEAHNWITPVKREG